MRKSLLRPSAPIACMMLTGFCATTPDFAPPLLTLPDEARKPCRIATLPPDPVQADLDAAYNVRGSQVAICDGRRDLAVQAFDAQQRAIQPPPRPVWWRRLMGA